MSTTTVASVIERARIILMDETGVRWPDDELLLWYNDAVLAVVNLRPDANAKNAAFICVRGTRQALPADALRLINVRRNLPGNVIRPISEQVLNDQIPNWHDDALVQATAKHYTYDDRDPKHFYLYPGVESGSQIEVVYSYAPVAVTHAQQLAGVVISIDDGYVNPLTDFILYRAYSKDANYTANLQRAQMHYQAFAEALQAKGQSDMSVTPKTQ